MHAVRNPIAVIRRRLKAADDERCRKAYVARYGRAPGLDNLDALEEDRVWWAWRAGWEERGRRTSLGWLLRHLRETAFLLVVVLVVVLFVSGRCDLSVQH